jgi:hypothetical protein
MLWLLCNSEVGASVDTDAAVGRVLTATVTFDGDRRVVRLHDDETRREIEVTSGGGE